MKIAALMASTDSNQGKALASIATGGLCDVQSTLWDDRTGVLTRIKAEQLTTEGEHMKAGVA